MYDSPVLPPPAANFSVARLESGELRAEEVAAEAEFLKQSINAIRFDMTLFTRRLLTCAADGGSASELYAQVQFDLASLGAKLESYSARYAQLMPLMEYVWGKTGESREEEVVKPHVWEK